MVSSERIQIIISNNAPPKRFSWIVFVYMAFFCIGGMVMFTFADQNFSLPFVDSHENVETTISVPAEQTVTQGEVFSLPIQLSAEQPVSSQRIDLLIDDELIDSETTNEDGVAVFSWDTTEVQPGKYSYLAEYEGNDGFSSASSEGVVIVHAKRESFVQPEPTAAAFIESAAMETKLEKPQQQLVLPLTASSEDLVITRIKHEGIEVWLEKVVGYEPFFTTVERQTTCAPENTSCTPQTISELIIDPAQNGPPIYAKTTLLYYNLSGTIIDHHQEKIGCFVCPTDHTLTVCYDYEDGFSDHLADEWKCNCKSGASCKIMDSLTKDVKYMMTDGDLL